MKIWAILAALLLGGAVSPAAATNAPTTIQNAVSQSATFNAMPIFLGCNGFVQGNGSNPATCVNTPLGSVGNGTAGQMAYYSVTGTAVSGHALGTGVLNALSIAPNASGGLALVNGTPTPGHCLVWSTGGIQDAGACGSSFPTISLAGTGSTSTGTLIAAVNTGAATPKAAKGIDFSTATFGTAAIQTPGFTVGPTGALALSGLASAPASSTALAASLCLDSGGNVYKSALANCYAGGGISNASALQLAGTTGNGGTLISAVATNGTNPTEAVGLDFSTVTFTSFAIHTPGFVVGPTGGLALLGIGTSPAPTAVVHGALCIDNLGNVFQNGGANCYAGSTSGTSGTASTLSLTGVGGGGTLISSPSTGGIAPSAAIGLDFSNVTFSTFAIHTPNFVVGGNGSLTLMGIPWAASTGASVHGALCIDSNYNVFQSPSANCYAGGGTPSSNLIADSLTLHGPLYQAATFAVSGGVQMSNSGAWLMSTRSGALTSTSGAPMGAPATSAAVTIQDFETIGPTGAGAATNTQANALDVYKDFSVGNGPRNGIQVTVFQSGATAGNTTASGTYTGWYSGIFSNIRAYVNDGGTSSSALKGQYQSLSGIAQAYNGATNLVGLVGIEVDVSANTGSSMGIKTGAQIISGTGGPPYDTVHGSYRDAAIFVAAATVNDTGWRYGLQFGGSDGHWPITSGGTIIGAVSDGSVWPTASVGLDFSNVTFSTFAIHTPNFVVGPTGGVALLGIGNAPASSLSAKAALCIDTGYNVYYKNGANCYDSGAVGTITLAGINSSSTLISSTATYASVGLDLSNTWFSSFAIHTPGFVVGNTGAVTLLGIPASPPGSLKAALCIDSGYNVYYSSGANCYSSSSSGSIALSGSTQSSVSGNSVSYLGSNGSQTLAAATSWNLPKTVSTVTLSTGVTTAPGSGQYYNYALYSNGSYTGISCTTYNSSYSCYASGSASISAGAGLYIVLTTSAGAASSYHRYSLSLD